MVNMTIPDYLTYRFTDDEATVNAFDELPLWSAAFGLFMFKHLELKNQMTVIDLGCGTGFPLFEIAGRIGSSSKIFGIDPWKNACQRAQAKLEQYGYKNVEILNQSAEVLPFENNSIDLIVSNLGINNFDKKEMVFTECSRVLKPGGRLVLTTNINGHWETFYEIFEKTLIELNLKNYIPLLKADKQHRGNIDSISGLFSNAGLKVNFHAEEEMDMNFTNGTAFFNHHFIKLGWLGSWLGFIDEMNHIPVFSALERNMNKYAAEHGSLKLKVPMLYMEGVK